MLHDPDFEGAGIVRTETREPALTLKLTNAHLYAVGLALGAAGVELVLWLLV